MRIRVGIRTHFFDPCVKYVYDEWRKLLGDDVFLLVDETHGAVDVEGAPKLSWTEADAAALGLPLFPEKRVPWHNGDYHIYHVLPHMEPDDFCFLVEHDFFLRVSDRDKLLGLLKACAEYDYVSPKIGNRSPNWKWVHNLDHLYDEVKGALVMIVGFNLRTAEYLLARRTALAEKRARLGSDQWPNVEAFLGTELCAQDTLKFGDLMDLTGMSPERIRTNPPFLFDDLVANAPADVFYHPCLSRERFLRKSRVSFRNKPPRMKTWNALWPFVSTASEAEMEQLDWLARKFWDAPSYFAAFPQTAFPEAAADAGKLERNGCPSD